MTTQEKYAPVLELGKKLEIRNGYVKEESGVLKIGGMARNQFEKDRLWDKIKEIGGESPGDIEADIQVENTDYYAIHTVRSGDTLGKIAQTYLGSARRYVEIFKMNQDILKDPNLIHPGQQLKIPFRD